MRPLRTLSPSLAAIVVAGVLGCHQVPVEVAAPSVGQMNAPLDRVAGLEAGRALYTDRQKCARCHRPKPISEHDAAEWADKILPRMAEKAKLSSSEYDHVLSYVLAARAATAAR